MARWRVRVKVIERYEIEVEGADYGEAQAAADAYPLQSGETSKSVAVVAQIGEPWLCRVQYHHRERVAVFDRAFGHEFTQADVDLIRARLAALHFVVLDAWNGAGASTASFRIDGKAQREFSAGELGVLGAPREG